MATRTRTLSDPVRKRKQKAALSRKQRTETRRLIDYFIVAGLSSDQVRRAEQIEQTQPVLVDRYPQKDWEDVPMLFNAHLFCLPHGVELRRDPPAPEFAVFCSVNENGLRLYGACLRIYEKIDVSRGQPLYASKALAFISRHRFFHAFEVFLRCLYLSSANATDRSRVSLEGYLVHFCNDIPVPSVRGQQVVYHLGNTTIPLTQRRPSEPRPIEMPASILFSRFSPAQIAVLLESVLSEKRILLLSDDESLLTPAAEILLSMIFPLCWRHLYLPVVPQHMFKSLQTYSGPFICCVSRAFVCEGALPPYIVCVDLDRGTVNVGFKQTPGWSESQQRRLKKLLQHTSPVLGDNTSSPSEVYLAQRHMLLFISSWLRSIAASCRSTLGVKKTAKTAFARLAWQTVAVQDFVAFYRSVFPRDPLLANVHRFYETKLKQPRFDKIEFTSDPRSCLGSDSDFVARYATQFPRLDANAIVDVETRSHNRAGNIRHLHRPPAGSLDIVANVEGCATPSSVEFCLQTSSHESGKEETPGLEALPMSALPQLEEKLLKKPSSRIRSVDSGEKLPPIDLSRFCSVSVCEQEGSRPAANDQFAEASEASELGEVQAWLCKHGDKPAFSFLLRSLHQQIFLCDEDEFEELSVPAEAVAAFLGRQRGEIPAFVYPDWPFEEEGEDAASVDSDGLGDIEISVGELSAFQLKSRLESDVDEEWDSDAFVSELTTPCGESEDEDLVVADTLVGEVNESPSNVEKNLDDEDEDSQDMLHCMQSRHEFDISILEAGFREAEAAHNQLFPNERNTFSAALLQPPVDSLTNEMRRTWTMYLARTPR